MDKNISQSNANLKSAAKQNIDTSPRVAKATADSANVSSSKISDNSSVGSESQEFNKSVNNFKRSTKSRPSYEGYMNSSSAHIQVKGSGYDNKKQQQARQTHLSSIKNPLKPNVHTSAKPNMQTSFKNSAIINNYTNKSMRKNSKSAIDDIVRINNLTF